MSDQKEQPDVGQQGEQPPLPDWARGLHSLSEEQRQRIFGNLQPAAGTPAAVSPGSATRPVIATAQTADQKEKGLASLATVWKDAFSLVGGLAGIFYIVGFVVS